MRRRIFSQTIDDLIKLAFPGVAGFMVGKAAHPTLGVTAGDWLSFAGAIVGVILAIASSVWIEDRKRFKREKESFQVLAQSITHTKLTFSLVKEVDASNHDDRYLAVVCMHARLRARQAATALDVARKATVIRNVRLLMSLQELESWLCSPVFQMRAGDNFGATLYADAISRARNDYEEILAASTNILTVTTDVEELLGDHAFARLTEF